LDVVWNILLPALGTETLPEDVAAQEKLTQKLASLNLPTVQGKASSAQAAKVSGKTYTMDSNDLEIESFHFHFRDSGSTITVKSKRGDETIPCGYGTWHEGKVLMFNAPWDNTPLSITTSGMWTLDDTFTIVVRLYTTPFFNMLNFHFSGDKLTVFFRDNVSFAPPKTLILTGQSA
jgi:hypothetical protein